MIKYALIMAVCSNFYSNCMPPVTHNQTFDTFGECIITAYEESLIVLKSVDIKEVDEKQLYTKFMCKPEREEKTEEKI